MGRILHCTKGNGAGNDFVLVLDRDGSLFLDAVDVRAICDRHFGVGADGLIVAVPTALHREGVAAGSDGRPAPEWFMDYRNADGSVAEMCGNGTRVFLAFLLSEGCVNAAIGESVEIATRAGRRRVTRTATGFATELGTCSVLETEHLVEAVGLDVGRPAIAVDVGNPHLVVVLADDAELDALDLHHAPTVDPASESGANIEFVVPAEPLVVGGVGHFRMRVHERGVGETLACGTGTVAAAAAVSDLLGTTAPSEWRVRTPGGELGVSLSDGVATLAGPAELSFTTDFALPA